MTTPPASRARRRRARRIALRWTALLGGLALASGALLVLYGVSLVDGALGGSGRPPCLRVTSAPWTLRSGEAWSPEWLGRVLQLHGLREVTPAAPRVGEFSRLGQALVVVGGPGAEPPGAVIVRWRATGVWLEDPAGRPLQLLRLPPVTVGTTDAAGVVRWPVSIAQVAPALLTAVVDVEDRTFLSHPGLSLRGMLRAAWHNLASGSVREGGSTITQQLAKNVLLRPVRTLPRKLLEAWLAALIDYRYDKRRILQAYLDRVYLGQDGGLQLHGVEAASQRLFGKRAAALNLEEAALVAGMIAAPNRFDPFTSPGEARRRRAAVLEAMVRAGHLAPADRTEAEAAPLPTVPHRLRWPAAVSFVDLALSEAAGAVGEVGTHLEPSFQAAVAEGCVAGLRRIEQRYPHLVGRGEPLEVAVAVVAADGRVLAVTGGRDPHPGEFNRAAAARRPVGSLVKPFVVAAALHAGRTLEDPLEDTPLRVPTPGGEWSPRNSDGTYRGQVSVREALVQSLNVPIVRLGMDVSLPRVEATLHAVGFAPPPARPAVLLGAFEASPLEVARAYAPLLNGGVRPELAFLATSPRRGSGALSPWVAQAVVEALTEVPRRGTAASLAPRVEGWLAAKTGTSDDRRDSWFVGLRRGFVVAVWVGFDDNRETGLFGATGALEVWREIDERIPPAYRP
ncbi:MAG: transglycosylase domain-containing protein [Thermoanaerobaculaceae bacterium]|nr:transglycosylase domain-containing protein [Thermoanaerobaculaceae bacterium]